MLLAQDIRPLPRSPQQRLVSVAVVAGIHVVAIAGILISLNHSLVLPQTTDITLKPIDPVKHTETLPPQPPVLQRATTVQVPPPIFTVSTNESTHTITDVGPTPNTHPVEPPVRLIAAQPIVGTHTTPDYPQLDARQGHEGNVLLKLSINEWGAVTDAQVERSSGYESLDRAAASWVKSHWLYHPATRAGDGVASSAEVTVTFRLTTHQ
jgi:periplasmic protein TonB